MYYLSLTLALFTLSVAGLAQADTFPGIEKLMTEEEYQAAGLIKLAPEEREALNHWLIRYTINDGPVIRRNNEEVKEAEKSIQIVSHIKPPFSGWTGETIFYLENGQIWQQRLSGQYRHHADSTEVVISKNFFGFYQMKLTATDKSVGVSRIR